MHLLIRQSAQNNIHFFIPDRGLTKDQVIALKSLGFRKRKFHRGHLPWRGDDNDIRPTYPYYFTPLHSPKEATTLSSKLPKEFTYQIAQAPIQPHELFFGLVDGIYYFAD